MKNWYLVIALILMAVCFWGGWQSYPKFRPCPEVQRDTIRIYDTGTDDTWSSTTSGQLPLLLEVDFHYPLSTVGSKTHSSK